LFYLFSKSKFLMRACQNIIHNENNSIEIRVYSSDLKKVWNDFVVSARNGLFLFDRDYMEYHSDRFSDHSLLFFRDSKIICLLPANIRKGILYSHEGLTFGGVISNHEMKVALMLEVFNALSEHCREEGIKEIFYKTIPYIYHSIPAEEDLYALFCHQAYLVGRSVSSVIYLPETSTFDYGRRRTIKKAKENSLIVKESSDLKSFMEMVELNLMERHNAKPTHSVSEIQLLTSRFPNNIKLFASFRDNALLAGILIYENKNVAKIQYVASSQAGRLIGANDIIVDYLINEHYKNKKYFDFGTSMLQQGLALNSTLISYKEGFGARAVVYDSYKFSP
jgi:hypothetical protein